MISISNALQIIARETTTLGTEKVALLNSVGRILRDGIVADSDLPPFDRSQMDGFAVIAADTKNAPVNLKIVGESAAGHGWHKTMKPGEAVRIMTGAPVPKGADAVQKVELTREITDGKVELVEPAEKGRFIVRKGSEIKKGRTIFKAGEIITENMIAALAAFGYANIKVSKQPRVAILGTGSEIVDVAKKPGRDQIRNSNSIMLDVLARKFGSQTKIFPISKDEISDLKSQIRAAAKANDILIITGGVSVGKYDLTKAALIELGAEIFFDKVRLKPGKPAVFARLGTTLVFGLPGNPVSAAVTFHLFVRRAILAMQGASLISARSGYAVARGNIRGTRERDSYLPGNTATDSNGRVTAKILASTGSSDFVSFSKADVLVLVPRGTTIQPDELVKVLFL